MAVILIGASLGAHQGDPEATEFCLHGQFDLGVRLQGMEPAPGEPVSTSWCVITERDSDRVHLRMSGASNSDIPRF